MLHYFVDGYNLLFRLQKGTTRSLHNKRQEVIAALNAEASLFKLNITVVFDGAQIMPDESVRTHYDALEIIYTSKSQSADEYILSALAEKLNCSKEVVITSDNQLALCCKMLNAQTLTIEAFLSSLTSKHRKKKKKTATVELQKSFQDTKGNISRLLKIFEERSKNPEDN